MSGLPRLAVSRAARAGSPVCALRSFGSQLGLKSDNEYGLYTCTARDEEHGGRFSHVKDSMTVADAVKKWEADDLAGSETL